MPQQWGIVHTLLFYLVALFNWFLYLGLTIYSGSFFKNNTEQDKLQLAIGTSTLPPRPNLSAH